MNLLFLDVETTGTDPEKDEIIEIGMILYWLEGRTVLQRFSTLLPVDSNPAVHINGISVEATQRMRVVIPEVLGANLGTLFHATDYIVAHNADFDRKFMSEFHPALDGTWICTLHDFDWPTESRHHDLASIAIAHGLTVDGSDLHRAMADCELLRRLFDRIPDLEARIQDALKPRAVFRAIVSYDDRMLAKDAGFTWDTPTKRWLKRLKIDAPRDFPFVVQQVT